MGREIAAIGLVFFAIISIMSTVDANAEPGPDLPTPAELAGARGHVDVPEIPIQPPPPDGHHDGHGPDDGHHDGHGPHDGHHGIHVHVHAQVPAPASSDDIGTTDGNDDAAPVGGPVPAGAFSSSSSESPAGAPGASAASVLEFSKVAGVAATATAVGAAFFF